MAIAPISFSEKAVLEVEVIDQSEKNDIKNYGQIFVNSSGHRTCAQFLGM